MFEGPTGRVRLIKTFEGCDETTLSDLIHCCAVDVEDAMIEGGAIPGADYSRLDIYQMATKVAIKFIGVNTTFTNGIPSSHPHAGNRKSD